MNKYYNINISGTMILQDEEFAWNFQKGRGMIISHDNNRITKLVENEDRIELIRAKTSGLYSVYFVDCRIVSRLDVYFYPKAIIIFNQLKERCIFDGLRFEGGFLNDLYDPIKHSFETADKSEELDKFKNGVVGYNLKSFEETDINFDSMFNSQKIGFSFNTMRIFDALSKKRFENDINTIFYSKFEKSLTAIEIIDLFKTIVLFFSLLLFSNSFSFSKIVLCEYNGNNEYERVGELVLNSSYLKDEVVSGEFQELKLFEDKLGEFFEIAVDRFKEFEMNSNMSVDNFIGKNIQFNPNFSFATSQNVTDVAMSFEHYYERLYSRNEKGVIKTDFEKSLNRQLVDFVENLLAEKEVINGKEQNKVRGETDRSVAKKYIQGIQRFDTSLENKIKYVKMEFEKLFTLVCSRYANDWVNTETGKIPFYFADYRNKLLHGKYVQMTKTVNVSYGVVRILTYSLLLSEVGFSEEDIIKIFNNFDRIS